MMQAEFLPVPTRATWLSNAERFLERRQFPKTLGAIDGKHIALVQPDHAGALFYNYKKFNSIVLLAIADSDSRFIAVDTVDMVFKEINDEHKFFLCECVEEKSVLWDPSHPEHHLAGPKMSAWLKIDEAFKNVFEDVSFGTAVLKETWTSINTTHRTTKNRVQGKTGDGTEDTEPTWKFWNATSFLRSKKPITDIQTRISNVGDKSPTEASSQSVGSAKRLATSSFRSYEELAAKKSNSDLQFEQLLATLEKDKKEIHPLALEISALLDEVGKQGGPHDLLVCKRDFRDVINSWEECLANEIYINNTQVADPEKSIQENTFG